MSPTLTVYAIPTPEGTWVVRCPQHSAWRPAPVPVIDRPALETKLKAHQTRMTRFQWMTWHD